MLASKLLSASGGEDKLFVDEVFSSWLYTGNGSTQTITNGIDLAGKGGLVWLKNRTSGSTNNRLFDTVRGIAPASTNALSTNDTTAQKYYTNGFGVNNVYSNGFGIGNSGLDVNSTSNNYVSWTFRKAPKFFDVVTYTGDGIDNRQVSHALGSIPGMVIVKRTDAAHGWEVWHRGGGTPIQLMLDRTDAGGSGYGAWISATSSTTFTVKNSYTTAAPNTYSANLSGATYVAYLFAHDPSADGIIQCGSYTGNGTGQDITIGFEPQFLLIKSATQAGDWLMFDIMRGMTVSTSNPLRPNTNGAESTGWTAPQPTATGFRLPDNTLNDNTHTYIYLAIRRPNKPPTTGTQFYKAIARTGTGAAATVTGVGFAPDVVWAKHRGAVGRNGSSIDRLRGPNILLHLQQTAAEVTSFATLTSFNMDGVTLGADSLYGTFNASGEQSVAWFFRRAPGVFDIVCYTGTGVARTVPHSLGVAPELMIVKSRSGSGYWATYHAATGNNAYSVINASNALLTPEPTAWNSTSPTTTQFTVGTYSSVNTNAVTYVAYLFATKAGISKVGSYTGNGSSQTINCGFSTGARFVMVKRVDSTGDWYVWDSTRGIVAGNDPHLSLNTTAAEVTTDDSIDPDASGFIVNQVAATNINVNAATYIFLAIA